MLAFNLTLKELVIFAQQAQEKNNTQTQVLHSEENNGRCCQASCLAHVTPTVAQKYKPDTTDKILNATPKFPDTILLPPAPPSAWPTVGNCYVSATCQGRPVSHMSTLRLWASGLNRQSCILKTTFAGIRPVRIRKP